MVENEIQYLPWTQFQNMVPSILGLEVTRLTQHLAGEALSTQERNIVVKVRYDVRRFIACVSRAAQHQAGACAQHLNSALLNAALFSEHPSLVYVVDRLQYVRDRMPYLY